MLLTGLVGDVPAWWLEHAVAWTDFVLFTFLVLWAPLDMNARMNALFHHAFFMMCFVNPHDEAMFNGVQLVPEIHFNVEATEFSNLLMMGLGCGFALLAMLLPTPLLASTKAK